MAEEYSPYFERFVLKADGGSRGNPGISGIGFIIGIEDGEELRTVCSGGAYIGFATNNQAEYQALIWGLRNAIDLEVRTLDVQADSELMIRQLNGEYKVKNEGIKPLFAETLALLGQFDRYTLTHIAREENSEADALVNEAMDRRESIGSPRLPYLSGELFAMDAAEGASKGVSAGGVKGVVDGALTGAAKGVAVAASKGAAEADAEGVTVVSKNAMASPPSFDRQHQKVSRYTLMVKDHFDAAHALKGYPGECKDLHGHTWDIEVSVSGTKLDEIGIVYDFKRLKKDLRSIIDAFDHSYLNEVTPFDKMNATAENLARVIFERLNEVLPRYIELKEVAVWESPIARVGYSRE